MTQLRKLSTLADDGMKQCQEDCHQTELQRFEAIKEIGNLVHDSVPVSNDEVKLEDLTKNSAS